MLENSRDARFRMPHLPQLANAGLCVLCHQELGEDAAARLTAFDDYMFRDDPPRRAFSPRANSPSNMRGSGKSE